MAEPMLMLQLASGSTQVHPGETLRVLAMVDSPEPWTVRELTLRLLWYTEGKGDRDVGVVQNIPLAEKGQTIAGSFQREEILTPPPMPWSYNGRVLKIGWMVQLEASGRGFRTKVVEMPFELVPRPFDASAELPPDLPPPE